MPDKPEKTEPGEPFISSDVPRGELRDDGMVWAIAALVLSSSIVVVWYFGRW